MALCTLTANISLVCGEEIVGGVDGSVYLINRADWDTATVTEDAGNPCALTAITLATGKFIYKIEGVPNSVTASAELARNSGRARYTHSIALTVNKDDAATKERLLELQSGRFVGIVFTNSGQVEVYGRDCGLVFNASSFNRNENDGAIPVTLASDEVALEGQLPANYIGSASPYSFATAKSDITSQVAA